MCGRQYLSELGSPSRCDHMNKSWMDGWPWDDDVQGQWRAPALTTVRPMRLQQPALKAAKEAEELCSSGQCAAALVPLQRAIRARRVVLAWCRSRCCTGLRPIA